MTKKERLIKLKDLAENGYIHDQYTIKPSPKELIKELIDILLEEEGK